MTVHDLSKLIVYNKVYNNKAYNNSSSIKRIPLKRFVYLWYSYIFSINKNIFNVCFSEFVYIFKNNHNIIQNSFSYFYILISLIIHNKNNKRIIDQDLKDNLQ